MIAEFGGYVIKKSGRMVGIASLFFESFIGFYLQIFFRRFRFRQTIDQMYAIAIESIPVVLFSILFISLMLILEFSFHMKLVLRQDSLVPAFSTMLMIRELGPVVTALLLASRVGASIAAETGSMKITDQLDALRMMAIDPVDFLTVPRLLATIFAAVSLTLVGFVIAILGGAAIASVKLGFNREIFFSTMFTFTRYGDLLGGVLKAAIFGSIIPVVASHHGFNCRPGADGVGEAATSSVVDSSVLIITADFVLTYLLYTL